MFIYLVRHGEKYYSKKDVPLTKHGKLEAKLTGNFLQDKDIGKVFSSPTFRTKETSDIISNILKLDYEVDERVIERFDWYGSPFDTHNEFKVFWVKCSAERKLKPNFGDSSIVAGKRMGEFLSEKARLYPDKNILVVTHGGIIVDYLRNDFEEKLIKISGIKNPIEIDEHIPFCSISTLSFVNNKFNFVGFANTKHLKKLNKLKLEDN